jgi:hypothetical protein
MNPNECEGKLEDREIEYGLARGGERREEGVGWSRGGVECCVIY